MTAPRIPGGVGVVDLSDGRREGSLFAVTVDQTPHTCLRPNDRTDDRTKARHRKTIKDAAFLATREKVLSRPTLTQDARSGRLRFSYAVVWETPLVGRRHLWDDDGLIGGGLKPIRDGICRALGIDDKGVETGTVEQSWTEDRQGVVFVVVALVEDER